MRYLLLIISILYIGCKKSETQSNLVAEEPGCIVPRSVNDGDTVEGQYIIVYTEGNILPNTPVRDLTVTAERTLEKNSIKSTSLVKSFAGGRGGFIAKLSKDEFLRLKSDANISMIEPDRIIALGNCFTVVAPWLITWNIDKVGYGDGTGKVAWVIDSGIDFDHPDLEVDKTRSKSFISGQTSYKDENGHGTHVAGIIGAKNNTFGVLGVASGATLISLRVLDKDGEGLLSSIIQALSYVITNGKAGDVVNLSLGEDGVSEILDQQVRNTAAKGIFISIAAGNDHKAASLYSPSRVNGENIYTVSAVDSTGKFASFSNYGNDVVDYAAPGVRIVSTYLNNKYAIMSGTSMAAPHVTGLLLLNGNSIHVSGTALNDPDGNADGIAHN
jgi:subtilisin